MNFNAIEFYASYGVSSQLPPSDRAEIVFSGRSNVGKSSLINKVANRKRLSRVSASPGKTVTINFFTAGPGYIVDLPGYGYAKVSQSEKERWGKLMESFFAEPDLMDLGVMIVDARHKPTADDVTMAEWFKSSGCPMVVVANKCDKLKKSEIEPNLARIRATLLLPDDAVLLPFSAEKGTGREALLSEIFHAVG